MSLDLYEALLLIAFTAAASAVCSLLVVGVGHVIDQLVENFNC